MEGRKIQKLKRNSVINKDKTTIKLQKLKRNSVIINSDKKTTKNQQKKKKKTTTSQQKKHKTKFNIGSHPKSHKLLSLVT